MTDSYDVLYTGRLKPDVDPEQAIAAFAARFRVDPRKVRKLFESGGEVTLGSGLDRSGALECRSALERIGLMVRIEPPIDQAPAAGDPASAGPNPASAAAGPRDPFEPPRAELEDTAGAAFHEPRSVPASRGWAWLREGFAMVFASPLNWIVAIVVWTVLGMVLNLIPVINFLAAVVTSVFMGGLMLGAHEQQNGQRFTIGHLFAGFSNKLGPLLLVGALYMVGLFAIIFGVGAGIGGMLFSAADWSGSGAAAPSPEAIAFNPMLWVFMLLGLALMIPLLMAYWFAPVLVVVDDVSAVGAMGMSFRACLKNILPFLVYGLVAMLLFLVGALPLFLGLLIVVPALVASVYTAYNDIFRR